MIETWHIVKEDNNYSVSSLGNIKSPRKVLSSIPGKNGYVMVRLSGQNRRLVHRLVALEFLPNPGGKLFINHKNGIKHDNRVDNLEWCTQKENVEHAISVLGKDYGSGRRGIIGKYNHRAKKVKQISLDGDIIKVRDCARDAYREIGIQYKCISACCTGKQKTAHGFIRQYS